MCRTLAMLFVLSLCSSGCGASAIQTQAGGTLVAMRGVRAARAAGLADLSAHEAACTDEACIAQARAANHPIELAVDALRTGVRAWISAESIALDATDDPSTEANEIDIAERAVSEAIAALPALAADVVHVLEDGGITIPPEVSALGGPQS